MSNNLDITIHDFKNICRTCLSKEDLKPLYGKYLVDMLMACTFVKFREDDGLPVKICTNCISEIGQAISFANRCEATDTILRKCVKKFETELTNNSSQSQKDEQISKAKEEIILPNMHQTVKEVLKQEVKQEEELIIENESVETYDEPTNESYEEDVNEDQDETNTEKSSSTRMCISSQITEDSAKDEDGPSHFSKIKPKLPYYECKKCLEIFSDFKVLKKHREVKHPQNKFSRKRTRSQYKNTLHSEPNDRKYQCQSCDKSFRRLALLNTHQKMHPGEEKENEYDDFAGERHEEVVGDAQGRKYKSYNLRSKRRSVNSQILEESSAKRLNLLKIDKRRKKEGGRPFVCRVCGKGFNQLEHLKVHKRLHTGKKPFVCSVCSKAVTSNQVLKYHMKIHTGEKPYSCDVCSKAFIQPNNLKMHMRIHTGEKPYRCEVCSKAFSQHITLKVHMSIHTGEKPYICTVCKKKFSQSKALNLHMKYVCNS